MIKLTLICEDCRAEKTFEGEDLEDLIKAINESDWTDKPDHGRYPQGSMPGYCPNCGPEKKSEKKLQRDPDRTPMGHDYGFESSKRRLSKL